MTDALERELRAVLAERAQSLPATDAVEWLQRARQRSGRRRSWAPRGRAPWSVVSATAIMLAAASVGLVLLLGSGTQAAFALWTASPTTPTPAELAATIAACNSAPAAAVGTGFRGTPTLTDQRGIYTAAVFASGDNVQTCISDGNRDSINVGGDNGILLLHRAPGPDQISPPGGGGGSAPGFPGSMTSQPQLPPGLQKALEKHFNAGPAHLARWEASLRRMLGQGTETHYLGRAGSDVQVVRFNFAGGTTVDATVQNGWYFAWWPSVSRPTSISVTTGSTTTTTALGGPGCKAGTSGCVFSGLKPQPPLSVQRAEASPRPAPGVPMRTSPAAPPPTTAAPSGTSTTSTAASPTTAATTG